MHLVTVSGRALLIVVLAVLLAGCSSRQTAMPALMVPGAKEPAPFFRTPILG